jgi:hypothetical protein
MIQLTLWMLLSFMALSGYSQPETRLLIDITADTALMTSSWFSEPDTAVLFTNEMSTVLYAKIVDTSGMFIEYPNTINWESNNNSLATVEEKSGTQQGEGIVTKVSADREHVTISASADGHADSIVVALESCNITDLTIAEEKMGVDTLSLNTNEETILYVWGQRSDDMTWVPVAADWTLLPESGANFELNNRTFFPVLPRNPSMGVIVASRGQQNYSVGFQFTPGPPVKAEFSLVSPMDSLIAGKSIKAELRIYNLDGLVPGIYCFDKVTMTSNSVPGKGIPLPYWAKNGKEYFIGDQSGSENSGRLYIENGVDTIEITMFHVDKGYKSILTIFLEDTMGMDIPISAVTDSFSLLPDEVYTIALEDYNGVRLPDTIGLRYPEGSIEIHIYGYDFYGNRIGPVELDVTVSGTLHPLGGSLMDSVFFYSAYEVSGPEIGTLCFSDPDSVLGELCIGIIVEGPMAKGVRAVVYDINENGYIDRLEVELDRTVSLPRYYITQTVIDLKAGDRTFEVSDAGDIDYASTSLLTFAVEEYIVSRSRWKQASLNPRLTISSEHFETISLVCENACMPVVFDAVKLKHNPEDRTTEEFRVELTGSIEKIIDSLFSNDPPISELLHVWRDSGSVWKEEQAMLEGITEYSIGDSGTISFTMDNGNYLPAGYCLSFLSTTPKVLIILPEYNTPEDDDKGQVDGAGECGSGFMLAFLVAFLLRTKRKKKT